MYRGVWQGNNIPNDKRTLILGESHYGDEVNDAEMTTAGVVQAYLDDNKKNTRKRWSKFFDKIVESFGYPIDCADEFFSQVYFGNYIEELCGVGENNRVKDLVTNSENRVQYNNSLFDFVNENNIETIVCFSILAFDNMPSRASGEENTKNKSIGAIGGRNDIGREYLYLSDLEHDNCNIILRDRLLVIAVRHPSASGGYNSDNVKNYLREYDQMKWLLR